MTSLRLVILALALACTISAQDNAALRRAQTVVLDETAVRNLGLRTAVTETGDFERTVFALGRIDVYPGLRAAISSRIPGRAVDVRVKHDHPITAGDAAVIVESRQAGNPPPQITLTAPISGLVSTVAIVPGEPVSPDKVLIEIVDLSLVYAIARIPEHLAAQLRRGLTAHITVPAAPGRTFTAQLEHLGVMADPESGTVEAAFHVDNPDLFLKPGMRAEFNIVVDRRSGITRVPREAVQGTPAGRFVYVKDFELPHAFVKTPVVVGESNERFTEIVAGLFPADEVVTQGAYALAFAGTGTLSLKEALDAAHGHEHNADGSEKASEDHDEHHSHDDHDDGASVRFWRIMSAVLFVALLVVGFGRRPVNA